jgi:peptidoglycan/LPS O-acetylase OafA/YrhL
VPLRAETGAVAVAEPTPGRRAGLDALRAGACLLVLLYHLRTVVHADLGPLNTYADHGDTGVFVFFALSGYLLYKPFVRGTVDLREYAIKRAARILPGYYLALLALAVFTQNPLLFAHPIPYATLTATYDLSLWGFMRVAWTLAAEVGFYIALPVLAVLARGREIPGLLASAAASIAYGAFVLLSLGPSNQWLVWSLPVVFYQFIPGMLLAVVEVKHRRAFAALAHPAALVLGTAILVWGLTPSPIGLELRSGVGAAIVMGWLVQHRVPWTSGFAFLGGMSYAVYLWHVDLLRTFGVPGLVLVLVGAAASWVLVERPILGWAHRIGTGLSRPATPRLAEVPSTAA